MDGNEQPTVRDSEPDDAPDLSENDWPEKFAKATIRKGWQTRIDQALRDWIGKQGAA